MRQETSKTFEGTGYRRLEPERSDGRVTINPFRRQLLSLLPRLRSKLLPHLLANRLIGVNGRLVWYHHSSQHLS